MSSSGLRVDAHVHAYPRELWADPVKWAIVRGERHWAGLVGPRPDGKPSLQGWADADTLLRAMDAAGIDHAVMLGWYWERQPTCDWHNRVMAQWVRAHPDRLSAFATVQPAFGPRALEDLSRALDEGLCGVGELFPAAQGFSFQEPAWQQVLELVRERGVPVNFHVSEPAGHDYPGKIAAPLSDYQKLARENPDITFIFAHWGGLFPFYELNASARKDLRNVFYDTAASPLLYDSSVYRLVAGLVGAGRILFGSDFPLRTFPRIQKEPSLREAVQEVLEAGLDGEDTARILGANMASILGLQQP